MAMNPQDLLDELYAKGVARPPASRALSNLQTWDPVLNPPRASTVARKERGAAIAAGKPLAQPIATPLPANRQGGPPPLPAPQGPRFAPKTVVAQPNIHIAGRGGIPIPILRAGPGRGAAPAPRPLVPPPAPLPVATTPVPATPVVTNTQVPAAPGSSPPALDPSGQFRTLPGPEAVSALNSENAGSATIQGRFLNKDGTRGPQETRAYTQGGIADAGSRVNVVPGLFSGVSAETEAALSAARQDAADRGDFEAVERSYMTPEQKQAANVQNAQNKILSAVGGAPLSQLPQVAQAVSGIQAGGAEAALQEQGLQKGALELEKGGRELQKGQEIQSMLTQLQNLDPNKPESKAIGDSIVQQILLAQQKYTQPVAQKSLGYKGVTDASGETPGYVINQDTGQAQPLGGAQAAAPPQEHIQMLQGDPNLAAKFEEIYGPGSAAQYLKT